MYYSEWPLRTLTALVAFVGVAASIGQQQNAVYFTNWSIYGRAFHPGMLPASKITHILYAFVNVQPSGEAFSADTYADLEKHYATDSWDEMGSNVYGCIKQLFLLKLENRQLKVVLSIGGASWSSHFATVASSQQSRELFADSSVTLMKDWGFDGIDIDWEFPQSKVEAADYVLLLQAVRRRLDAYAAEHAPSYHFQLSIASSAGSEKYGRLDLKSVSDIVDCFYLMGYDYSGSWSTVTGHQANLHPSTSAPESTPFSTGNAVTDYIAAGVPSHKIILGMPLYGRSFDNTNGFALPLPGAKEVYDGSVGAVHSWDPATRELVSYDSPSSVRDKVAFIKAKGLGGAMFWEASADRTGNASLIETSYDCLAKEIGIGSRENLVNYADSRYNNLAGGMVTG
ncbi:Putative glycoside hydrolase family 18, catalytic domain, glycosyl hydrolase family 18 (GH18) active [Colletotrichum destructivum]|uniref:chitinase n=1 Tax=Colletotrichum destructivum TaxID=34406 RepID=A0AAX4J5C1_9PEZI|nr:Putative glycoside hydrolase family 18, catalytic domain, glycosyl hydrolase family 18 (GH18) active [Colletotrichum destructivum]